jgi:hypothetical protein
VRNEKCEGVVRRARRGPSRVSHLGTDLLERAPLGPRALSRAVGDGCRPNHRLGNGSSTAQAHEAYRIHEPGTPICEANLVPLLADMTISCTINHDVQSPRFWGARESLCASNSGCRWGSAHREGVVQCAAAHAHCTTRQSTPPDIGASRGGDALTYWAQPAAQPRRNAGRTRLAGMGPGVLDPAVLGHERRIWVRSRGDIGDEMTRRFHALGRLLGGSRRDGVDRDGRIPLRRQLPAFRYTPSGCGGSRSITATRAPATPARPIGPRGFGSHPSP